MRFPSISTYMNSTYRLGLLTGDLANANEKSATQKDLNEISDNPLGLSQVLTIKNSLGNIDQISENVNMGKSWLRTIEEALGSTNDILLDIKTDVARLANDSTTADERSDAINRIDAAINQIVALGNTQVNGNYVFSGTDTNTRALTYNKDLNTVTYNGNSTAFEIRTDRTLGVEVGRTGDTTFWDQEVEINSTNDTIVFKEDNGQGDVSERIMTAQISHGLYRTSELETALRNALNEQSTASGYGVNYNVRYDETEQTFSIREDGSYNGYIRTEFMWESGGEAYVYNVNGSSDIDPMDIALQVIKKSALSISTTDEVDGSVPIRLTWKKADKTWEVSNNPGYIMPTEFTGTDRSINIALNENNVTDLTVTFGQPVADGAYIEFEVEPLKDDDSLGHEIGFFDSNHVQAPPVSDSQTTFVTDITISTAAGNNSFTFIETNTAGTQLTLTADFNTTGAAVTYTDMDTLATAIETAMEAASAAPTAGANTIDYSVTYDSVNSRFNIREDGTSLNELTIEWSTNTASAQTLGYYPLDDTIEYPHSTITIDNTNKLLDFSESTAGTAGTFTSLQATVAEGVYTDLNALATAVEEAMEAVSAYDYSVSYDATTGAFSIEQTGGAALTDFNLLWDTGNGGSLSIGETLGFDPEADDTGAGLGPHTSDTSAKRMSVFSVIVDGTNNMIDFEEVDTAGTSTTLSASIAQGTYTSMHEMENLLERAMNNASATSGNGVLYDVSYDEANNHFDILRTSSGAALNEFKLLWDTGTNASSTIGDILGYDTSADDAGATNYSSSADSAPTWITLDSTNNRIDFREIRIDGTISDEINITIPEGNYNDLSDIATHIETELRAASPNNISYAVIWDDDNGFLIKGSDSTIKGFNLLWQTGDQSSSNASQSLGFAGAQDLNMVFAESDEDVVNIVIDATNDKIDFKEIVVDGPGRSGTLLASIDQKTYTSHSELAQEIEEAMEAESLANGNTINYSVSWDSSIRKFTIKENGTELKELHLLWESGDNAPTSAGGTGESIGSLLGFSDTDIVHTSMESTRPVEWGIFNTLIDLKQYLNDNDRNGIERTIGRLETNYDNMTSRVVDSGMKYSRLDVRENINRHVSLNLKERRSNIEDADIIETIMNLRNIETAYQAALSSTSRILSLSLVDFLS